MTRGLKVNLAFFMLSLLKPMCPPHRLSYLPFPSCHLIISHFISHFISLLSSDEALSVDSDDESLSSSTESSSSSTSSSSSSEDEDEEEGEQAGSGLDTMDESTMDSTALDTEKGDDRYVLNSVPVFEYTCI